MQFFIRPATPDDYPAFVRLYADLETHDDPPPLARWFALLGHCCLVATDEKQVVGYLAYAITGDELYIRQLAVSEACRRSGIASALIQRAGAEGEAQGVCRWVLNVKDDNTGACALYHRLGFTPAYRSEVVRIPWDQVAASTSPTAEALRAGDETALAACFGLAPARLLEHRNQGKRLLTTGPVGQWSGFASFDPDFGGCFPAFAHDLEAFSGLLRGCLAHRLAPPEPDWRREFIQVVLEDQAHLGPSWEALGGQRLFGLLHLRKEFG